jgi:hypothetical protein
LVRSTDSIATVVIGLEATVEPPSAPLLTGDNYLNLAHQSGLGTNRLQEIEVVGACIDDVRYELQPAPTTQSQAQSEDRLVFPCLRAGSWWCLIARGTGKRTRSHPSLARRGAEPSQALEQ